jgi:hypothetical protein
MGYAEAEACFGKIPAGSAAGAKKKLKPDVEGG